MKTPGSEIGQNFIAGTTTFPWGTLYQEVCAALGPMHREEGGGTFRALAPGKEAYGLSTEYAEIFSWAPDRPVMSIRYDLSCDARQMAEFQQVDYFANKISEMLGPPVIAKPG